MGCFFLASLYKSSTNAGKENSKPHVESNYQGGTKKSTHKRHKKHNCISKQKEIESDISTEVEENPVSTEETVMPSVEAPSLESSTPKQEVNNEESGTDETAKE